MLPAISLLSLSLAYQTPLKLDFSASPLKTVLIEVEKQTGLKLNPGPLGNRPIIVHVKSMSSRSFLDQLASALDASWEPLEDTLRLSRGPGRIRVAQEKEAAERAVWLKDAMAKVIERKKDSEDWSDVAIQKRKAESDKRHESIANGVQGGNADMQIEVFGTGGASPADLFLIEAMRKLPVSALAGIQPGQRVVFSNFPNRMQRGLPYSTNKIPDFVKAYNLLASQPAADTGARIRINDPRNPQGKPPITGVAELLMVAQRYGDMVQVTCIAVAPNGDVLGRSSTSLNAPARPDAKVPDFASGEVVLSEKSKKIVRAIGSASDSIQTMGFQLDIGGGVSGSFAVATTPAAPANAPLEKDIKELLSKPATNEPLATFPAEVWDQVGDLTKKDVIAVLPDSVFVKLGRRLASGKLKVAELFKIAPHVGLAVNAGETITVTPLVQADADRTNIDRAALEPLLVGNLRLGYSRLDDISRYSLKMPEPIDTNLDQVLIRMVSPDLLETLSPHLLNHVRLYGAITPNQRQADSMSAAVAYTQMDNTAKSFLEALLYKAGGFQMFGDGEMVMVTSSPVPGQPVNRRPQQTPAIMLEEPTEAMPNGVPQNSILTMDRKFSEGVLAFNQSGKGSFLSAGDLGMRLGMDRSNFPAEFQAAENFTSYGLAAIIDLNMAVRLGRQDQGQGSLRDAYPHPGNAVAYDKLPDRFKSQVEQAKKAASGLRTVTAGGRGVPPPQR
ncbi:MAG: hypothetical protein ABL949_01995 [Fimbriimonadaceae bacterium]